MSRKTFDSDSDSDNFDENPNLEDIDDESEDETEDSFGIDLLDSDSDDAPEDISFSTSKQNALDKVREAIGAIKADKDQLKLKRKERDEKFSEQKRAKIEALEKSKLPESFLENLESKPVAVKEVQNKDTVDNHEEINDEETGLFDGEEENASDPEEDDPEVKAVYIKEAIQEKKSSALKALEFRKQRLYGKNGISRESSKKQKVNKEKRIARFR